MRLVKHHVKVGGCALNNNIIQKHTPPLLHDHSVLKTDNSIFRLKPLHGHTTYMAAQSVYILAQNKAFFCKETHGECEHIIICDHSSTKITQCWGKR